MKRYKVNSIKELIMDVTNQKVISVSIVEPYLKEKSEPGKLNLSAIKAFLNLISLKVAADSEYAKHLFETYLNDEEFEFDITLFLGINETTSDQKKNLVYYHESVDKHHLIEIFPPFFNIKFIKTNDQVNMIWDQEISNAGIDIALRDILIYLRNKKSTLETEIANSSGSLQISVSKFYRELTDEEKQLQKNRLFPGNNVQMNSTGFSFDEIKQILNLFKTSLPTSILSRLHYEIDFINLSLKG